MPISNPPSALRPMRILILQSPRYFMIEYRTLSSPGAAKRLPLFDILALCKTTGVSHGTDTCSMAGEMCWVAEQDARIQRIGLSLQSSAAWEQLIGVSGLEVPFANDSLASLAQRFRVRRSKEELHAPQRCLSCHFALPQGAWRFCRSSGIEKGSQCNSIFSLSAADPPD
jgi:hypothetical protein